VVAASDEIEVFVTFFDGFLRLLPDSGPETFSEDVTSIA